MRDPTLPRIGFTIPELVHPELMKQSETLPFNLPIAKTEPLELLERRKRRFPLIPFYTRSRGAKGVNYRAQYLEIMHMRKRMKMSPVVCERRVAPGSIPLVPFDEFKSAKLSPSGEVLVLWQLSSLHILDLRPGGMRQKHQVNVLFLPFDAACSTPLDLHDISVPETTRIKKVFFSGSHLVVLEGTYTPFNQCNIHIMDLAQGATYLARIESYFCEVEIFESTYLLVSINPGKVFGAPLRYFRSNTKFIPFPTNDPYHSWAVAEIDLLTCELAISLPLLSSRDLSPDAVSPANPDGREICPIWCVGRDDFGNKVISLVKGSMPPSWIGDDSPDSLSPKLDLALPSTCTRFYLGLDAKHLPYGGRETRPKSQSEIKVYSHERRFGDSQALSVVGVHGRHLKGFVLSDLSLVTSQSQITHNPLLLRNSGRWGTVKTEPLTEEGSLMRLTTIYNERGGRIVLIGEHGTERKYQIRIYQV
ncbi:hypothetical protein DL93DRAFT_2230286 [Clavulina sp. PMI_390]|nr:hypothetical protein DL93DRAFT_2230286 [Clavulina sp. PMI_390]